MDMVMIGGLYKNNDLVGYRIFDRDDGKVIDVDTNKVKVVLKSGIKIENLGLRGSNINHTNGAISRYPKINDKVLDVKPGTYINMPVIILNKVVDSEPVQFIIVNYAGVKRKIREGDLISYVKRYGIANGKVVSRGNTEYIAAISGEYKGISIPQDSANAEIKSANAETKSVNAEDKSANPEVKPVSTEAKPVSANIALSNKQLSVLKSYYNHYKLSNETINTEIGLINHYACQGKLRELSKKTELLNSIIFYQKTMYRVIDIFGTELGTHIISFIESGLPFTRSLAIKCSEVIKENLRDFYSKALFNGFDFSDYVVSRKSNEDLDQLSLEYLFSSTNDSNTFLVGIREYLEYMCTEAILGEYIDSVSKHLAEDELLNIRKYTLCNKFNFLELRMVVYILQAMYENSYIGNHVESQFRVIYNVDKADKEELIKYGAMISYALSKQNENKDYNNIIKRLNLYIVNNDMYYGNNLTDVPKMPDTSREFEYHRVSDGVFGQASSRLMVPYGCADISEIYTYITSLNKLTYNDILLLDRLLRKYINTICEHIVSKRAEEQAKVVERVDEPKKAEEVKKAEKAEKVGEVESAEEVKKAEEVKSNSIVGFTISDIKRDIANGKSTDKYDKIELYKCLVGNISCDKTSISFKISDDMVNRGLSYNDMSHKQKYRLKEAIAIMLDALGNNSSKASENNVYELDKRSDIKANIDVIMKSVNSSTMNDILQKFPNVIKICNTVLRTGKVSDKQLRHISGAIEILNGGK